MVESKRQFRETKVFDVLAAAPIIGWYGFAVVGIAIKNARYIASLPVDLDWKGFLDLGSQLAIAVFLRLQVILFLIRVLPIETASGLVPRVAAFVGANLALVFLALPRVVLSPAVEALSTAIVLFGTLACVVTAFSLGRAFSILPQARRFVASGPYRLVRHPLYLAEQVATWGLMIQFEQPWAALLALAILAAQFPCMYYEEQVLKKAFPAYSEYAARTKRFIPGVY